MTNPAITSPQTIIDDFAPPKSGGPASKPVEERLQKLLDKTLHANGRPSAQKIRNFLNGTWLGEPLHVVLTDVPIGAWTVAMVFDALDLIRDKREFSLAADTSIAIGLLGAAGAAVTGITDWSDVDPPARRLGLIHGLLNVGVTALFTTSLILRKRKLRTGGRVSAAFGYALLSWSAHLGGKMVYEQRVGVDRTAGEVLPKSFAAVFAESKLADSTLTRTIYEGVPILLVRRGQKIFAMAETCSHFSGPLSEGKLVRDSIVCPYHASRFALDDGRVLDGPAVHPQPCLEVRVRNGQIEVRRPPAEQSAA
ncbi:MAG: Rieske 2Fe-2S domain-containing protein [Acidobacteria bacterium]|nr:Rieske 2Fe-2S domain-containing protein [Acidobacteriota bacterium]